MDYQKKYMNILKVIVLSHIDKDKYFVFLYGSRAKGNNDKVADVDIGVMGEKLPTIVQAKIMAEVNESIVPYHVDIIDFIFVDDLFKEKALEKIEVWNRPKDLKIS